MSFHLIAGDTPNIWLGKFNIFPEDMFIHGISTRHGGFSHGSYSSLNLGLHVEDDAEHVVNNRIEFCRNLGVDYKALVTCQQVHSANVAKVTRADKGKGLENYEEAIANTDALITNEANIPLMLFFADCTPIILADPVHKAVGVAHGGWKGTVKSIAVKTIEMMGQEYGTQPEDVLAGIGPAIGPCCYQVGEEVAQQFRDSFPEFADEIIEPASEKGKSYLNLWQANARQLLAAGVLKEHIEVAGVCTACHNQQFFSYRADGGRTGRIGALICLK